MKCIENWVAKAYYLSRGLRCTLLTSHEHFDITLMEIGLEFEARKRSKERCFKPDSFQTLTSPDLLADFIEFYS